MPADQEPRLEVTPYEHGTRLRCGDASTVLWQVREADATRAVHAAVALARSTFVPRWQAVKGPNLSASALAELLHRIVFEWLYARAINGRPLEVTADDLAHPYAWRQVRWAIARELQLRDAQASTLAATLLDITPARYVAWIAQETQMDEYR